MEDRMGRSFVLFRIEGRRYALPLHTVERVIHAVEVTPLPKNSESVLGTIQVGEKVVSVVNIRKAFHCPDRELRVSDQIVIAEQGGRNLALVVDEVAGVIDTSNENETDFVDLLPESLMTRGILKLADGAVHICDLEQIAAFMESRIHEIKGME